MSSHPLIGRSIPAFPSYAHWPIFTTFAYDSDDNRLRSVDATTRTLTFAYDLLTRLASVIDDAPTPNTTTFTYDAVGNRTEILDAKSRQTLFRYDDLDRLIEVEQVAESLTTGFAYDAAGNVTKVTDPLLQETAYAYDALSRLTSVTQQLSQVVTYAYDGRGRLDTTTNARGNVLDYSYLPWGGLEKVEHYLDIAAATAGTPIDRTVSYSYDASGNLETTTDSEIPASPLYTFTYDPLDRVDVATAHYLPGGNRTLDSDYDRFGNRDGLDFTDGSDVLNHSWVFGDLDRLDSATLTGAGAISFAYFANDELHKITHRPGGVETTYAYRAHGPVRSITTRDSTSGLLHDLQYTVDATLNVDTISEMRGAGSAELFDYDYDGIDRLTQAINPTAYSLPAQEDYTYDDAGNRETPGVPSDYAYDANNRLTASPGKTWAFDDDGNVTTRNATLADEERFTFDKTNRLRDWEKGPVGSLTDTASYVYDPFGRRIQKTANGVTTWFLWDGDDLLAEFDGSGARTRRYAYAGGFAPVQVADPTGPSTEVVYDVHTDHLDTPRMLTDSTQSSAWRQSHESFGEAIVSGSTLGANAFNIRFPGQYLDAETGLHYNRFRYFDPAVGRYLNVDPLGQLAGVNVFPYVLSRATALDDPFGLQAGPYGLGGGPYGQYYATPRANNGSIGPIVRNLAQKGVNGGATFPLLPAFGRRPTLMGTFGFSGNLCFDEDEDVSGFRVSASGGTGAGVGASTKVRLKAPVATIGANSGRPSTTSSFPLFFGATGTLAQTNKATVQIPYTPVTATFSQAGSGPVVVTGGLGTGASAFSGVVGSINYSYGCTCSEQP